MNRNIFKLLGIEETAENFIPYTCQIDQYTVKTKNGDLIQTIKIDGLDFDCKDHEDLVSEKGRINRLLKNLYSPELAIWTHIVRRLEDAYPKGEFEDGFANDLNKKYKEKLKQNRFFVNDLYITIVLRPSNIVKKSSFFAEKISKKNEELNQLKNLEQINDATHQVLSSLSNYGLKQLSSYTENNILYSEILEFLAYLINLEWQKIPLPKASLDYFLSTSRLFFGNEKIEVRTINDQWYGGFLAFKELPSYTEHGKLNAILSAPFPYILTQSFVYMSKPKSISLMQKTQNVMINAGDLAQTQIDEIDDALNDLVAGEFVLGSHHLSFLILCKSKSSLKKNIADFRANLADIGGVVVHEDIGIAPAFWSQLPTNFEFRPRTAPITSINFAGFSSFHNFPLGRQYNNQWGNGEALTILKTQSGSPFYFNLHLSTSKAEINNNESNQEKALGNTLIFGRSGGGKTVLQAFLLSQFEKFKPKGIVLDKDRGQDIFIRAMGGNYAEIEIGKPTGFNPFSLEKNESNINFIYELVKVISSKNGKIDLTNREEQQIINGINGVYKLPTKDQNFSSLLAFFDLSKTEGFALRFQKWCRVKNQMGQLGNYSWVFDNEKDNLDLSKQRLFGFDITQFLEQEELREPIIMYLLHRAEEVIDGQPFIMVIDEFWQILLDQSFSKYINNKLKVIRKQNGLFILATQSVQDVLAAGINHTIIEQCPTMIFLPNSKAKEKDYIQGLGLTHTEFDLIKNIGEETRMILIKQGESSVIVELDLKGMDDELSILSGSTDTVRLLDQIRKEYGDDPKIWLPIFQEERKKI